MVIRFSVGGVRPGRVKSLFFLEYFSFGGQDLRWHVQFFILSIFLENHLTFGGIYEQLP